MSPRVFASLDEFAAQVGKDLGSVDGPVITQPMIDEFSALTGSDDWIHTDPVRAASSQFGGTLVHADLVLSLLPRLMDKVYHIEGITLSLIYGSERVRIIKPIPVDSQLRLHVSMLDATVKGDGLRVTLKVVVETDTVDKPVVIAEPVYWYSSAPRQGEPESVDERTEADAPAPVDRMVAMFREAIPGGSTLEGQRAGFESVLAQLPLRHDSVVSAATYGGVDGYWVAAAGAAEDRVGVMLHGGGFVMGSAKGYCAFAGEVSRATGARIFLPEYKRAPENPYPAALNEVQGVLKAAADEFGPDACFAIGDSAGGGLLVSALTELHRNGTPLPASIVLISALIDLTVSNASFDELADVDPLVRRAGTTRNAGFYLGGRDATNAPSAFPMLMDLSWLPPSLVLTGGREVLRDDSRNLAEKLQREGAPVTFHEYEGMYHVWPLFCSFLPEGEEAVDEIGAFVRARSTVAT